MLDNEKFLNELIDKWNDILPHSFYYDHLNDDSQANVTKLLNEFYFGNETVSDLMKRDKNGLIEVSLINVNKIL